MFPRFHLLILVTLFSLLMTSTGFAVTKIAVTKGNADPIPVAFIPFWADSMNAQKYSGEIAAVMQADLVHSGMFRQVDHESFIEQLTSFNKTPDFSSWRPINAAAIVTAEIRAISNNLLEVKYRIWDVYAGTLAKENTYTTPANNWRRLAHILADAVYTQITGEGAYFDTRIVYISETGPVKHRLKRLAVMDQDGANHHFLAAGSQLVLTPRFAPSLQQIAYLSFQDRHPYVHIRDLATGKDTMVGKFDGMTYAPRFSPDGHKLLIAVARRGNSDIFEFNLQTKESRQLTDHPGIDVSPSYSPDMQKIVFTSDRGGKPQLYVMNEDGSKPARISFGSGLYMAPSWSPRGDFIAFTKQMGREFYIGVVRPDGSGERILTGGYLVEGPTWAPNGRVIMFAREFGPNGGPGGKRTRLFSIDLTGYNEHEIPTPLDASDPAWSPLLR